MRRRACQAFRPQVDRLDDRCLPAALTPSQVTAAYGLNAIAFNVNGQAVKGNGAGMDIAIVDAYHNPNIVADLLAFDRTFGLADPPIGVLDLAGASTNDGWALEEALDVEWVHAIAPGAEIIVVEARSDSLGDLLSAVNVARNLPGITAVSMSWGASGFPGQASLDAYFTTPAGHTGVTFIAASGDEGASGGAEWPASSAKVLSVGGTTLRVSASGIYQGESLWSGSTGGYSNYVSEPSYQYRLQSTGRLMTPDVSFDADPSTGVYVYSIAPSTGSASWPQVGGTSLGAPAWAAIIAIADQGRALAGAGTLDGATQTLPMLFSLPATDFHAVASLSSRSGTVTAGLGTPDGAPLVYGLAFGTTTSISIRRAVAGATNGSGASPAATGAGGSGGSSGATTAPSQGGSSAQRPARPAIVAGAASSFRSGILQGRNPTLTSLWRSFLGAFGID